MTQDSKLASRGNSFEIENLIKVCIIIHQILMVKKICFNVFIIFRVLVK